MSVWIIEESHDGGKTWKVSQPYHLYKSLYSAERGLEKFAGWRRAHRINEYRPVLETK